MFTLQAGNRVEEFPCLSGEIFPFFLRRRQMRYVRLRYGIEESQKAWEAFGKLPERLYAMGIRRMLLCRDFTLSPYDFDLLLRNDLAIAGVGKSLFDGLGPMLLSHSPMRQIGMKCMPNDVTLRIRIVERHGKPVLRLVRAIPVHGN